MNNGKHIIHLASNREWGGGEQYIHDLCARLKADGYQITMFIRDVDVIRERMADLNVPTLTLPPGGAFSVGRALKLARFLKNAGECVVCAHNFKDAFTAVYARIMSGNRLVRVVMTRHLVRKGKGDALHRWMYRRLDKIIFDSELSCREFLSGCADLAPKLNTCVVPIGINVPEDLKNADLRKEFGIDDKSVVAMFHGRLDAEKGLDVLIEAMSKLQDIDLHLILIGTGHDDYVAALKQHIAGCGLTDRVSFAGFRNPVLPCLGSCDFGLLPSIVREGYPLSPMEYMSQGRCVIATDNGGQKEYLTSGDNALLVKPGDADMLADAIRRLATDKALRDKLSAKAYADFSQKMSYNKFIERIEEAYEH